jgi:hypothetical protein
MPEPRQEGFQTVDLSQEWAELLRTEGAGYAGLALANIRHEFPAAMQHTMSKPGDFPYRPRARTPVFYGSFDWHSSVQMHWTLLRLLRAVPGAVSGKEIRAALGAQFTPVALAAEAEFVRGPDGLAERPQGWGWALALVHEAASWDNPDAQKWAEAMGPLAEALAGRFLGWLPGQAYPVRYGSHQGSAFALSLAWPFADARATAGDAALRDAIATRATGWFTPDSMYPADWEPSGDDCISPALTEAELMARILAPGEFAEWLSLFLPGVEWGRPAALFTPAAAGDPADGHDGHLHGLNANRAWCWRRIAESLPSGDPRTDPARAAARQHAKAVLPYVVGGGYPLERWLASYAVLMLS